MKRATRLARKIFISTFMAVSRALPAFGGDASAGLKHMSLKLQP